MHNHAVTQPILSLLCLPNRICTPDDGNVDEGVEQDNPGAGDAAQVEAPVDDAEHGEEQDDGEESLVHGETHAHEQVVDVSLVGGKHFFVVLEAEQGHAHHVDAGQEDQRDGGEQGFFAIAGVLPAAHLVLDGEVGNDEADEQAACVAHEYLVSAYAAKEVEDEETQYAAAQTDRQQHVEGGTKLVEEPCEDEQDEHGQTGGKPVDAVDEVHGVDDEQDAEDGEGVAQPEGEFVETEEAVQVVNHHVAGWEHHGCCHLHGELVGRLQSAQVVEQADQVDEQCAHNHEDGGEVDVEFAVLSAAHDAQPSHHADGCGGHEDDAAQPGDGKLVYLACVGLVVKFMLVADSDDVGNQQQTDAETQQEGDV